MTLELERKIKRAALNAAVELALKRMDKSPERCVRNLVELGLTALPGNPGKGRDDIYTELLSLCRNGDNQGVKALFFTAFF